MLAHAGSGGWLRLAHAGSGGLRLAEAGRGWLRLTLAGSGCLGLEKDRWLDNEFSKAWLGRGD